LFITTNINIFIGGIMLNKIAKIITVNVMIVLSLLILLPDSALSQECYSLDKNYGYQGAQDYSVVISGIGTHFEQGVTQVSFDNPGITVVGITVKNVVNLTVVIDIAEDAVLGKCDVTVTTGLEEVICDYETATDDKTFNVMRNPMSVTLSVGDGTGALCSDNNPVLVSLQNTAGPVKAINMNLCDRDNFLTPSINSCEATGRAAGYTCSAAENASGCLSIALYNFSDNASIDAGTGAVFKLNFYVSSGAPVGECRELYITNENVSDGYGDETIVTTVSGEFCYTPGSCPVSTTTTTSSSSSSSSGGGTSTALSTTTTTAGSGSTTTTTSSGGPPGDSTTTTTTTDGPGSSTTTTSATFVWPLAYEKLWGPKKERNLEILREFRDEILLNNEMGRQYVSMLYGNTLEILTLLLKDRSLSDELKDLTDDLLPVIEALIEGENTAISEKQIKKIDDLLKHFEAKKISSSLREDINIARKDIKEGVMLKLFDVSVY
jgi:hypothetical protein